MPKGSKVEEVYQALLREGHDKESAARIAQSQTGLSLSTGKPPKGNENMAHIVFPGTKEQAQIKYPRKLILEDGGKVHVFDSSKEYDAYVGDSGRRSVAAMRANSFANGRARAEAELGKKFENAGVKVKNSEKDYQEGRKDALDGKPQRSRIGDYGAGYRYGLDQKAGKAPK